MGRLFIYNIGILAGLNRSRRLKVSGAEMAQIDTIENAWILAEEGRVHSFGAMDDIPDVGTSCTIDANGGCVLPSFCDSHTHIVNAGSREGEFVDKIRGLSYAEIARRGGGILNSADRLHLMSEDELFETSMQRLWEVIRKGTGAIEIKSGYGLNTEDELKMLRVIRRMRDAAPIPVVATFLGAHAVGREYAGRQSDYVDMLIRETLPEVGRQGLADYIDVFCDEGFFTPEETSRLLEAGAKYGLRGKIHGQELADSGGVEVAVRHNALSVDHLESSTERDIALLRDSSTMPTALPGTSFFLNMSYAPVRRMIDAGLPVALASDYNPGSTPSGDMKFVVSLACIRQRLLPSEALQAATLNSAYAMGLSTECGSLALGCRANLFITSPIPSVDFIPYAYTTPILSRIILNGEDI
ncbi:MAG: imidazolonepropionase [Prevotella sp.]|nr:imidazolonepropionase [Prevotella sp.]MBQ9652060.1 imidazolonepropionase [Prevotella sp.]